MNTNSHGSGQPVIQVSHLTKEYRLGAMENFRSSFRRMLGRPVLERHQFKALDDVSFSISRGEVVGIIGHNGAGKSTLLKHLCRISTPTSGTIKVTGRVAPLIEVGAGLIGDMTGRENIYLNATILGMSKKEIDSKIDEIIDFAELERFIDTPIKRYSSGMQVRLGFSIATAVVPDILIVDEVLAVGDVAFQRKCIDRMERIKDDPDTTLLIVGHNIRQLERICTRMIVLHGGRKLMDDESSIVSQEYYRLMLESGTKGDESPSIHVDEKSELKVEAADIFQEQYSGRASLEKVESCSEIQIELVLEIFENVDDAEVNVGFHNSEMVFVVKASTRNTGEKLNLVRGRTKLRLNLPDFRLSPGPYGLGIGVYDRFRRPLWAATGYKWIDVQVHQRSYSSMPAGTLTYSLADWEIIA